MIIINKHYKETISEKIKSNINYFKSVDFNEENRLEYINKLKESLFYCNKLNLYNERIFLKNVIQQSYLNDEIELRIILDNPYLYIDNDNYSDRYGFYGDFKKDILIKNSEYSYKVQYDIYKSNLNENINPDYLIRSYKNIVLNTNNINLKNKCLEEIYNLYKTSYSINNIDEDYFYVKNYNNDSKDELITVIVTSYNQKEYIEECLLSILNQDYSNIELIVADDSSRDFDITYYRNFIESNMNSNLNRLIIYKNRTNMGTVSNLNKAKCFCSGTIIKTIGSDDTFYDNYILKTVVEFMIKNNYEAIISNIETTDINMNKLKDSDYNIERTRTTNTYLKENYNKKNLLKYLKNGTLGSMGGCFFNKFLFEQILFDEEFLLLEDLTFLFDLIINDTRFEYLDEISLKCRVGSGITTTNDLSRKYFIWKEFGIFYDKKYDKEYTKFL